VRIFLPLEQGKTIGGEKAADARGVPAQDFFQHGTRNAHGVVAEDGAPRDARDELGLGDGDGEASCWLTCIMTGRSELPSPM